MVRKRFDFCLVILLMCNIALCIYLATVRDSFYFIAGDTSGYQINSLKELSTIHRAPGLQLISLFFYRLFGDSYQIADVGIVCFQYIVVIVGNCFLYLAISNYVGNRILGLIISIISNINMLIFGYVNALLTECYAIAAMSIQLWCVEKTVDTQQVKYITWSVSVGMICSIIRPSHLLTVFILGGFIFVYGLCGHKWILKRGLVSIIISGLLVLGYCTINKVNHNYFGISDVKPFNDMATVLYADIYDNSQYPEISEYAAIQNLTKDDNWTKAKRIVKQFGFDKSNRYISSCKADHNKKYLKYLLADLNATSSSYVIYDRLDIYKSISNIVNTIREITLPFSFGGLWFITGICLCLTIIISVIKRRMLWVELGICVLILTIHLFSRIECHTESLVRTGIHALPCIFFLYGIYAKGMTLFIKKTRGWKNNI